MTGRVFFFFLVSSAYAQDSLTTEPSSAGSSLSKTPPIHVFETQITTATRRPRLLKYTPVSISVIDSARIAAAPARNIDDLLATERGIILKRPVGMGEGIPSDIDMRGVPGTLMAARTLILVDGIPTNASGTPFLILNEIPVEAIKQIEIVRGPFSSLYGANAFSGVINVITEEGRGKARTDFNLRNGNMAFWDGGLWTRGGSDKVSWSVAGGYRSIGNYYGADSILVRGRNGTRNKSSENSDYNDVRFFGRSKIKLTENQKLSLNLRFFDSKLGFGLTDKLDTVREVTTGGQKWVIAPFYDLDFGSLGQLRIGGYYRQLTGEFWREAADSVVNGVETAWVPTYWVSKSNDLQTQLQWTFEPLKGHTAVLGFENLWNQIDFGATVHAETGRAIGGSKVAAAEIVNTAVFLQDEIVVRESFVFLPGIRVDNHSDFGIAWSPNLGALWTVSDAFQLRTSLGRGFRAPSLGELYMPPLPVAATTTLVSNSRLRPETIRAGDFGITWTPASWFLFTGDLFVNKMFDFIRPRFQDVNAAVPGDESVQIGFDNTSEADSWGFENEVSIRPFKSWTFFGNYSWTSSLDYETLTPLDYIPEHRLNLGSNFKKIWGDWWLSSSALWAYTGVRSYLNWSDWQLVLNDLESSKPVEVFLDDYWKVDIALKFGWKKLKAGVSMQNIFDERSEEMGGFSSAGRMFWVQTGLGF